MDRVHRDKTVVVIHFDRQGCAEFLHQFDGRRKLISVIFSMVAAAAERDADRITVAPNSLRPYGYARVGDRHLGRRTLVDLPVPIDEGSGSRTLRRGGHGCPIPTMPSPWREHDGVQRHLGLDWGLSERGRTGIAVMSATERAAPTTNQKSRLTAHPLTQPFITP